MHIAVVCQEGRKEIDTNCKQHKAENTPELTFLIRFGNYGPNAYDKFYQRMNERKNTSSKECNCKIQL